MIGGATSSNDDRSGEYSKNFVNDWKHALTTNGNTQAANRSNRTGTGIADTMAPRARTMVDRSYQQQGVPVPLRTEQPSNIKYPTGRPPAQPSPPPQSVTPTAQQHMDTSIAVATMANAVSQHVGMQQASSAQSAEQIITKTPIMEFLFCIASNSDGLFPQGDKDYARQVYSAAYNRVLGQPISISDSIMEHFFQLYPYDVQPNTKASSFQPVYTRDPPVIGEIRDRVQCAQKYLRESFWSELMWVMANNGQQPPTLDAVLTSEKLDEMFGGTFESVSASSELASAELDEILGSDTSDASQ